MVAESEFLQHAEEVARLLAAAVASSRLYPPSSALPAEAVQRFTERSCEVTAAQGPLRYVVDPDGFRIGDVALPAANAQLSALAKSLHALQVGQLVIAPELNDDEASAFIAIVNSDPGFVRSVGGPRTVLASARVVHIAVVEVSLRASDEEGLLGLDLISAPQDEIAVELASAAEQWATATDDGVDTAALALNRLEEATQAIAIERASAALMRLDESTRMRVLACALRTDSSGRRMDGMLRIIAEMKPASLARLLTLVAHAGDTEPMRIAAALPLCSATASRVASLLEEMATENPELAELPSASELATQMTVPRDGAEIARQIAAAATCEAAGRALATAISISSFGQPDADTVRAIADTLEPAARAGAFPTVRQALRRLDELSAQPELTSEVAAALARLTDPEVLADLCERVSCDSDAAIAGEILQSAGPAGADVLLESYIRGSESQRSLLRPALRASSESVLGAARVRLRNEEPARANAILAALPALGDRRAIPVISEALAHLDERVRFAAITALADAPQPEAAAALIRALGHPEPETQRFAVREIGRVKAAPAVYQLTRALEDINVLHRTYETKKEVVYALESIGTPDAHRALKRTADRGFVLSRKSRELRNLARQALKDARARVPVPSHEGVE